jgi:cation diffusion facilitator family transporter
MKRGEIHVPQDKQKIIDKAWRHEIWSIVALVSIIIVLGLTMGSSQAMRTMWLEDLLSLVPTTAVLIGIKARSWQPDENFNYGYRRTVQIGFLAGSVALFGFGLFLLGDSIYNLIIQEHPSIQTIEMFGARVWLGWLMIAALVYSVIPPMILGQLKRHSAEELHDKSIYISATVDKGDWLSGVAAIVGILGIAFGYWWADSAAAAFISYEIVKDGWEGLKNSTLQLMNMRPTDVTEKNPDPVIEKVEHTVNSLPWVRHSSIRLREEGDVIMGEAFVVPADEDHLLEKLGDAGERVKSLDWRIQDFNFIPVSTLELGGNNGVTDRHH